jgi:hypothetical protein
MSRRLVLSMTAALVWAAALTAPAQQRAVAQGSKLSSSLVRTPTYDVKGMQSMRTTGRERWVRIDVQYETFVPWLDGLKMKGYALARTDQGPVVLTGEVEFINVPGGTHYAVMFLHRRVVERYTGGSGKFERFAVELMVGNQVVDRFSPDGRLMQPWWQGLPTIDGAILPRDRTPWAMLDFDAYEQIKR